MLVSIEIFNVNYVSTIGLSAVVNYAVMYPYIPKWGHSIASAFAYVIEHSTRS